MIISLDELNYENDINIELDVDYDEDIDKRIKGLRNAKVKGSIQKNSNGDITLNLNFSGEMLIEDAITLELVYYPFQIIIDENLEDLENNNFNVYEKMQNTLDLKAILWQNIVLEVPISYTKCHNPHLKGNGWELKDENEKAEDIDPRLQTLKDLLKGDD